MEMVSPTVPILEESIDEKLKQEPQSVEYREYESDTDDRSELITSLKKTEETTIKIENDLYVATISSICGGSIKSFEIKKHLKHDSSFVNLVTIENTKNLLVEFKDFNGKQVQLDEGWASQSKVKPKPP